MDSYDRRHFLKTTLPGFLGLSLALPALAQEAREASKLAGRKIAKKPMDWDAFTEAVAKFSKRREADAWAEETYVRRVAAMARRLRIDDPHLLKAFEGYANKNPNWPEFESLHREQTFEVTLIEFEKGEAIRHHDHPQINGIICCASGDIRIQNYDFLPANDERPSLLRQVDDLRCQAGAVSTLTSEARNIHALKADAFTQLVDVFSPPYNAERSRNSRWFELDEDPYQGIPGLYECWQPRARKKAEEKSKQGETKPPPTEKDGA